MMTFDEFNKRCNKRMGFNCYVCDVNTYGSAASLCEQHFSMWKRSDTGNRTWAYEQYKRELIKQSINVWKQS